MNPKHAPYGWLVKRIARRLEQNMNNFLKPYNITIMQYMGFNCFCKQTEKCYTFKELEKQFEVSQPTIGRYFSTFGSKKYDYNHSR